MKAAILIDQETQKVNLILDWQAGNIGNHLTASEAENVTRLIESATQEAGCEAFQAWLMQFECHDDATFGYGNVFAKECCVSTESHCDSKHRQRNGATSRTP
jgi:hypothetical protein